MGLVSIIGLSRWRAAKAGFRNPRRAARVKYSTLSRRKR